MPHLKAVHYAASSTIYQRNADQVGYTTAPVCLIKGDTIGTDRARKVTCHKCLAWLAKRRWVR